MTQKSLLSKFKLHRIDEEFIYFLTFAYALSTCEIGAIELFKVSKVSTYGRHTKAIRDVYNLGVGWKYGLSTACEMISERMSKKKEDPLQQFLIKISQVVRLGDELRSFLKQELESTIRNFTSIQEQGIESQKLLLEMFYTIMSTASIMVAANSLLIMLVGGGNGEQIMTTTIIAVLSAIGGFVLLLHFMFPKNSIMKKNFEKIKSMNIQICISVAISVVFGAVLHYTHAIPLMLILAVVGVPITITGFLLQRIETIVSNCSRTYPSMIMHFGQIYSALGTIGYTLDAVLKSDFGPLQKHIIILDNRIKNKINTEIAFDLFSKDTGSAVIASGNTIVSNSLIHGADMKEVGYVVSEVTSKMNEGRAKRTQLAKTFEMIVIVMHVLTLAVFGLMNKIALIFTSLIQGQTLSQKILPIHPLEPHYLNLILPVIVLSLSIISGFAIKVSYGGTYRTVLFNIGMLLILGALTVYGTTIALSHFLDQGILNLK